MFQNIPWVEGFVESGGNESYWLPEEATTQWGRSQIKFRVLDKLCRSLWMCVEYPRNEIDNPIRYCTQPLYAAISTFMAANLRGNLVKEQNLSLSRSVSDQLEERLKNRTRTDLNALPGWWGWLLHGETGIEEYCVSAYLAGKISTERAIEFSGLDQIEFASRVRERSQEKDLPTFRAYLRGETVEEQLPFSEEVSNKFKNLMAKEIE
jgi:hypothetical protein